MNTMGKEDLLLKTPVSRHMSVVPALSRLRQEDPSEMEASLDLPSETLLKSQKRKNK